MPSAPSRRTRYRERSLEPALRRSAREFPVVLLTGPRQSGKTTLLRHVLGAGARYVSLEPPDVRASALSDPRGFLDLHPPPVVLDEVQHAPALLSYLQERVDAERSRKGRWFLTGSQNLLVMQGVTQTLAGRVGVLRLLPFSGREQQGRPAARLPWEGRAPTRPAALRPAGPWGRIVRGGYPELVVEPRRDAGRWHAAYQRTYVERDVRTLRQVGDLMQFHAFVRMLAARSGSLLDLSDISRDLGVAVNTVKAWLSVLEASWQVVVVRPWFANIGKRLVKSPKVYWTDTGALSHLLGVTEARQAAQGPSAGALFETAVLCEILQTLVNRGEEPRIHFWRTATGQEVDFLVEHEGRLVPIEAKASATPTPGMAAGIHALHADLGELVAPGYVVHAGEHRLALGEGVLALPFRDL